MQVPFVDLKLQYANLKPAMDAAIARVIADTAFVGGRDNKYVRAFEEDFSRWLGVPDFVGCANGTDSLELLLQAAGIGRGDEVIVPALTWISTSEAVSTIGATPVFVDIDPVTFTIDVAKLAAAITPRTRAIIPVHLYGQTADMDPILTLAARHKLFVLEDCAQAHGATYKGRKVGTMGDACSFSFYPGKNLGAYGDAGGFAAKDKTIHERARMLANHGQPRKHDHQLEGRNSRLDGLQAAVLSVKLPHLDAWNAARVKVAAQYDAKLADLGNRVRRPAVAKDRTHVYHLYVVRVAKRDAVTAKLKDAGIATAVHYPTPLPLLAAYKARAITRAHIPAAATACDEILSLPMYPEMTSSQIDAVVEASRAATA
jgi:dTDP-4-amino-4,6-dideoxygalactose transaminase